MEEIILQEGLKVKEKKQSWREACINIAVLTGLELTPNALEKRYSRMTKHQNRLQTTNPTTGFKEKEIRYGTGLLDAEMLVNLTPEEKRNDAIVLAKMGYDPNNWSLEKIECSNWNQHTKEQTTKQLYAIKIRLKPKKYEPSKEEYLELIKEFIRNEVPTRTMPKMEPKEGLNENLLMFLPALELHLGKVGYEEISQEYNSEIAKERFFKVHDKVIEEQKYRKCGTLYYPIGNDFFNSDTTGNTTTAGTQMTNDNHWKLMWKEAVNMHTQVLLDMRKEFNRIDIECLQGNHDTMASFYLVEALRCRFFDDEIIKFSDNLKKTTHYLFGKNLILMNHGSSKGKQNIIDNVPSEYREEWSKAENVFFFFGHEHHMEAKQEKFGIWKEKLSSLSGTDEYHQDNGYTSALQQQQFFIFDKEYGRVADLYVNFPKKKLIKTLKRSV